MLPLLGSNACDRDLATVLRACLLRMAGPHVARAAALARLPWPLARLRRLASHPSGDAPFRGRALYRGAAGEVLLLSWRSGGSFEPEVRDRGGVIAFVDGAFEETRYERCGDFLSNAGVRSFRAPNVVTLADDVIHSLKSANDDGLSLHFYVGGRPASDAAFAAGVA